MRYLVLKPATPTDPRKLHLVNHDALLAAAPAIADCELESEAVMTVREMYPDAVAMPIPVQIGSGTEWLMAVVADSDADVGAPEAEIPFVLFVRAVPERGRDKQRIADNASFDRKKWKSPVHHATATTANPFEIELRGTDLDTSVMATAIVGRLPDGRTVITTEVGGIEVSIAFKDRNVGLTLIDVMSDLEGKLSADGQSAGSSYDPKPW